MTDTNVAEPMIDLNDPSLSAEVQIDPNADAFAYPPPPVEGTYRAKLKLKENNKTKQLWTGKKDARGNVFLFTQIEAKIIAPDTRADDIPVFDSYVDTMPKENTGTSRVAGVLKALGKPVPARTTHNQQKELLTEALAAEPTAQITIQWEASCQDCQEANKKARAVDKSIKGYRPVRGMKRFPQLEDKTHKGSIECPECGQNIGAQARIVDYEPDVQAAFV